MFLTPGESSEREAEAEFEGVKKELLSQGAKIQSEEKWGKRYLAYEIAKNNQGYYFVLRFELEPKSIPTFNQFCRLEKGVIRYLTTVISADIQPVNYSKCETRFGNNPAQDEEEEEAPKEETKKPVEEKIIAEDIPEQKGTEVKKEIKEESTETVEKNKTEEKKPDETVETQNLVPKEEKKPEETQDLVPEKEEPKKEEKTPEKKTGLDTALDDLLNELD